MERLAPRGGDPQSSAMPVSAASTNSEWASMRFWGLQQGQHAFEQGAFQQAPTAAIAAVHAAMKTASTPARGAGTACSASRPTGPAVRWAGCAGRSAPARQTPIGAVPSVMKASHSGPTGRPWRPSRTHGRCTGWMPGSAIRRAFCRLPWHQRRSLRIRPAGRAVAARSAHQVGHQPRGSPRGA